MTNHNDGFREFMRSQDPKRYESYPSVLAFGGRASMAISTQDTDGADMLTPCPPPPQGSDISIAVDPVALITTECITVTSSMRKHVRWAQSSVSAILGGGGPMSAGRDAKGSLRLNGKSSVSHTSPGTSAKTSNGVAVDNDSLASRWGLRGKKGKSIQDNPLMSAFARLRSDLRGCTGQ